MKTLLSTLILCILCIRLAAQTGKGATPLSQSSSVNPKSSVTRAVVVGISDYQDKDIPDLRFADRDAEAFANFLRSPAGGSLDGDHLKVLTNSEATMAQFANALDWLWEMSKEGDEAIIYFSGHGDVEKKSLTQPGFLLCWDAPSRVYMAGGAFALPMLQEVISTLSTQNKAKVVVITDACHSGKLSGSEIYGAQLTGQNLARQYANEIKILSCQPNEVSIEGEQWGGGRGAFSYNLVDALYGLADNNTDLTVTLQEIARYLEEHVTAEVAPVSQVPMVVGNRTTQLATVDKNLLADLRSGRANQLKMLSPIDPRGMEDEVLTAADTSIREMYHQFNNALKEHAFFKPKNGQSPGAYAEAYFERLIVEPALAPLHSTMRRNYASALQDDAQQAINAYLKTDILQLECLGTLIKLDHIPRELERASELLGEGHYMHGSLQARKKLFEGILLGFQNSNPDKELGYACLDLFRKSSDLEPQSPLPLNQMVEVYMNNLRQPDSAWACAELARELAPNWVLPFTTLAQSAIRLNNYELALKALKEAEKLDSSNAYVISGFSSWYACQASKADKEKAITMFENYRKANGILYPCWHNNYGGALMELGRFDEAEAEIKKGIALDSMRSDIWNTLAMIYFQQNRFDDAYQPLLRSIGLDSSNYASWNSLGSYLNMTQRFSEAEPVWLKVISLDTTRNISYHNLGYLYFETGQNDKAVAAYKKSVEKEPSFMMSWQNMGRSYIRMGKYEEALSSLQKAIEIAPNDHANHRFMGYAFYKMGRMDEARRSFEKSLTIKPDYAGAMLGMAYLAIAEGKNNDALSWVEKAIQNKASFQNLERDVELAVLRSLPEWKALMKKYFPDQIKD